MTQSPRSPRKQPQCKKCGTLMAGHKRPNGIPMCPTPSPMTTPTKRNVNFNIPPPITPTASGSRHGAKKEESDAHPLVFQTSKGDLSAPVSYDSSVSSVHVHLASVKKDPEIDNSYPRPSTSRAPPIPRIKVTKPSDASSSSISSASTSSSLTTKLKRTVSWIGNSTPLAYVFCARRDELTEFTRKARDEGFYTALVHNPNLGADDQSADSYVQVMRHGSWGVIVGTDPGVVAHTADLFEKDARGVLACAGDDGKAVSKSGRTSLSVTRIMMLGICSCSIVLLGMYKLLLYLSVESDE
ncbi:unnamed protein product [Somion occarium]|uniref:Uncharacterized protein n=1 Tax=Somion occarium TaxID=3059160 RepID=A0ABP1D188_9APHY